MILKFLNCENTEKKPLNIVVSHIMTTTTAAYIGLKLPSFKVKHTQYISNNLRTKCIIKQIGRLGFFPSIACKTYDLFSSNGKCLHGTHKSPNYFTVKKPQQRCFKDSVVSIITLQFLIERKMNHVCICYWLIPYLHKVGVLGIPDSDHSMHLLDQLLLLVVIELHVPFGQSCLPCSVLDEDEADLCDTIRRKTIRQNHLSLLSKWLETDN